MIRKTMSLGFDGIQNFPTYIFIPTVGALRNFRGVDSKRELDMVSECHKLGIFNMWYAATPKQATEVAEAGTDVIVPHCGWTCWGARRT